MAKSLQGEWQYLQRVLPPEQGGGEFAPVEDALAKFRSVLLAEKGALPPGLKEQLELPVRRGGLGLPNPVTSSESNYQASRDGTSLLADSIRNNEKLDVQQFSSSARTPQPAGAGCGGTRRNATRQPLMASGNRPAKSIVVE